MTITADSPLIGKSSGTLAQAIAWAGQENAEYIRELWRLCELVGLDFGIIFAQACVETGDFTNKWWLERYNAGSIGITGFPPDDEASQIWDTQTDAARGHVAHMIAYVFRLKWTVQIMTTLRNLPSYDERWDHAIAQPWAGTVRTIRDLTGRWATDPKYHEHIVNRHRAIFGVKENAADDTSDGASQGDISNVSTPVIYDLMRDYARFGISQEDAATVRGYRFENRNGFDLDAAINPEWIFIVLHVQAGTTRSSLDWWANGYVNGEKVTASSTVMIQRDGSILNVIPEQHAPWTNGDDNKPTADGMRLVSLPGNSNLYTLSIEAEGMTSDEVAKNGVQCDAIAWQVQKWRADYGIPIKNILRHADINSVDRPYCGTYRSEIIKRLTPVTPPAPQPAPIWWEPGKDVGIVTRASDGYKANAMLVQTYATTKRDVPVYDQIGGKKIAEVAAGKPAIIGGTTRARDAKATGWYFVKVDGGYGRARASSFLDKLPMP